MKKGADWLGPLGYLVSGPVTKEMERIFADLPVLEEQRPNVEGLAVSFYQAKALSQVADEPRNKTATPIASELKKVAVLSRRLREHFEAMHWSSIVQLKAETEQMDNLHPIELSWQLSYLEFAAERAVAGVNGSKWPCQNASGARKMTDHAARVYEQLTGLRPTVITDPKTNKAGGPFLAFLEAIYREFDIKASPESQAREYIKEKIRPKNKQ